MKSTDDFISELAAESGGVGEGTKKVGYDGQAAASGNFSLVASKVDVALDSLVLAVDEDRQVLDDYQALLLSQTAAEGSVNVGYDGHNGANTLFTLPASQVDAALDGLVTGLDAEMKSTDDYIALVLSQTAGEGSSQVGYDGQAGANGLASLPASQVDAALDSLVTQLDAEMKSTDDFISLLASQTDGEGSANVGYDGYAGTNTEITINAGTVEATLDTIIQAIDDDRAAEAGASGASELGWEGEDGDNGLFSIAGPTNVGAGLDALVDGLDAEMKSTDDYIALVLSQTAGEGSAQVGYDGNTPSNSLFSLPAAQVDATLDALAVGLDAEMKSTDDFIALLNSQTAAEGSANVGYDGITTANSLFNLSASQVDAALDSLATGLDAEMKVLDDYQALLLSQTAGEGSTNVGYDGQAGANGLASLAASTVDVALDSLVTQLDAEMKSTDDFISLLASQTGGEGSTNIGYDGHTGTNTNFSVAAGTVEGTLDSIIQQIDTNMENNSSTTASINALSVVGTSAAAYTHTVNHALNTQDILYNVWVDQSGSYKNDIVSVTNLDANNIVVELTEEKAIKWAVFSMEDIS